MSLLLWRSKVGDSLSAREWALFDRSIQEIKFKIMTEGKVSGSEAIERAMRESIDGKRLYDVVQDGLRYRLNRLVSEKSRLEAVITENTRLHTRPGDEKSAQVLADGRRSQGTRLDKLQNEITEAEEDLRELERHGR